MSVSIVIPARNEEENIVPTVEALETALAGLLHETLIVDDHSTDSTAARILQLQKTRPRVRLVANTGDPGFAAAVQAGFRAASGEAVAVVMADACDDPATILEMEKKFREGYDLVCGSRYIPGGGKEGGPKAQGFFSFWVNRFLRSLLGFPSADASNAFKLYRRELLMATRTGQRGFALSMELAIRFWQNGYRITDVPTVWKGRKAGESKFKFRRAFLTYSRLILAAIRWKVGKKELTLMSI